MDINNPQKYNTIELSINQGKNQDRLGYLYRHIRLDTNMPFYIGIGSMDNGKYVRGRSKTGRNNIWKGVVKRTEYRVEIMMKDIKYNIVLEKEKEFIKLYGRIDLGTGTLVNLSDGGDGNLGYISSKRVRLFLYNEREEIIREYESVLNAGVDGFDGGAIIRCIKGEQKSHLGYRFERLDKFTVNGYKLSVDEVDFMRKETKKLQSKKHIGLKRSDESKRRMSEAQKGKKISQEQREKISERSKGRKHTDEFKVWISQYNAKFKLVTFDENGCFLKEYISLNKSKIDGLRGDMIIECVNGKRKYHKGFVFKKFSEGIVHGYKIPEEQMLTYKVDKNFINIKLFDKGLLIKEYLSITLIKSDGFFHDGIGKSCKDDNYVYKGFKFMRLSKNLIHGYKIH